MPAVKPEEVTGYVASADVGVCFLKNGSLNDDFCLPNKLFECIFAGIPVIVNRISRDGSIGKKYQVGVAVNELNKKTLASSLTEIKNMDSSSLSKNLETAKAALNWQVQENILIKLS